MGFRQFINRLFPYLKSHIGKLALTSITMVFATALETAIPEITGQIVDTLFGINRSSESAQFYSILLFGTISISAISTLIALSAGSWISNKVIADLRVDMFSKLIKLPKSYFDKNTTGETLSKLTFDVEQISDAASTIWLEFIKSSFTVVILTAVKITTVNDDLINSNQIVEAASDICSTSNVSLDKVSPVVFLSK